MKTNFRTTVMAIALVASVTGVFASNIKNALSNKARIDVSWQRIDEDGNPQGSPVLGTEANPFPEDCDGLSTDECARGTIVGQTTPSLHYYYN